MPSPHLAQALLRRTKDLQNKVECRGEDGMPKIKSHFNNCIFTIRRI